MGYVLLFLGDRQQVICTPSGRISFGVRTELGWWPRTITTASFRILELRSAALANSLATRTYGR
jgi:hypothetical protein